MPRTKEVLEWSAFGYAAIDWVEAWDSKDQTDIYGLVMSSISWQEVLFDIYPVYTSSRFSWANKRYSSRSTQIVREWLRMACAEKFPSRT